MKKNRTLNKNSGFTLLEILIVITIIGIIASALAVKIMVKPGEAKALKAMLHIETMEGALKLFKLHNGFYPSTEQGLQALVEKPATGRIPTKWQEDGYIEKGTIPKDPWEREYLYVSPGVHNKGFDLWTYGADDEEGGEDEDTDITNWTQPTG
ncbi:MAG: type II secretion system major pseudopilin GspG [Deltaproteobacteria bacterium]|nr:type II secretion system major pseudopilin GspG [Deltaproteobacteria bacterium]